MLARSKITLTLYGDVYAGSGAEAPCFAMRNFSELVDAEERYGVVLRPSRTPIVARSVGSHRMCLSSRRCVTDHARHPLLTRMTDELTTLQDGKVYDLDASWRIKPRRPCDCGVFMQAYVERTHDFSEVVLSLMPQRACAIGCAI